MGSTTYTVDLTLTEKPSGRQILLLRKDLPDLFKGESLDLDDLRRLFSDDIRRVTSMVRRRMSGTKSTVADTEGSVDAVALNRRHVRARRSRISTVSEHEIPSAEEALEHAKKVKESGELPDYRDFWRDG